MPKCLDNIYPNLYTGDDIEFGTITVPEGKDDSALRMPGVGSYGRKAKMTEAVKLRCQKCNGTYIGDFIFVPGVAVRVKCTRCKQFVTVAVPEAATP